MTTLKTAALAALTLTLLPSATYAVTYTKGYNGGNLPINAILTGGLGDLTAITGSLNYTTSGSERTTSNQSVADLYALYLTGTPFSATTVGQMGDPTNPLSDIYNTVLYLFDSTGKGVLANDDDPNAAFGSEARSTIFSSSLAPGLYYLGISTYGYEPTSAAGLIFPDQIDPTVDTTGLYGPTGPGGGNALSGWKTTSEDVEAGTYSIALTGVRAATVPEPAPLALLAPGSLLLLVGVRQRRRTHP